MAPPRPPRARRYPSRRPSRRPTRRARVRSRAATTPPSARAYSPRADAAAADVRPRPVGSRASGPQTRFSPPRHPPLPNSPRWWTRSRRRSAAASKLCRGAHPRARGERRDAPALGARRRRRGAPPTDCSYADPASLLALLDADQATAARAILGNAAYRRDGARGSSFTENADRSERNAPNGTLGDALANRDPDVASPRAQTPPSAPSAPEKMMHQSCGARARIERETRLGPAVTRALASARDTCSYAPPPEALAAAPPPAAAATLGPSAAGRRRSSAGARAARSAA